MTSPTDPALSLAQVTDVMLGDGGWYTVVPGTIGMMADPQITDPFTGAAVNPGPWLSFTATNGITYGVPIGNVQAVKWVPPQVPGP